jgi:hypothetical protein
VHGPNTNRAGVGQSRISISVMRLRKTDYIAACLATSMRDPRLLDGIGSLCLVHEIILPFPRDG